ncbi:MAG: peptide-methionine (S)-S-oxide reductase MsrA [Rhodospirillaceae bacterium]
MKRYAAAAFAFGLLTTPVAAQEKALETAIFAGGCFWCMEPPFDKVDGVVSTTSGYAGGAEPSVTYEQVSSGQTGHAEAVRVVYDPGRVAYAELLEIFWRNVDPLDGGGQFCDRGPQYRSALFPQSEEQFLLADASIKNVAEALGAPVATKIETAPQFWEAEGYHQDYASRNPIRYTFYRASCGRDHRLNALWNNRQDLALAPR